MGLYNCKIHGERGVLSYASAGIVERILLKKRDSPLQVKVINVVFQDNSAVLFDRKYYFTEEEFNASSFKDSYLIQSEEDDEKFSVLMINKLRPICVQCFNDFMTETGHANLL